MITIHDVAARAGVSKYTVSAVLGGRDARIRIASSTRARVLEAVKELDYHPNAIARSLKSQKSGAVGFYSPGHLDFALDFSGALLEGMQKGCESQGLNLLVLCNRSAESLEMLYSSMVDGRIDALVIYSIPSDRLLSRLIETALPCITVADAYSGLPSVVVDDAGGAQMLAEHLWQRGHRKILYRDTCLSVTSAQRRREAFYLASERLGMQLHSIEINDTLSMNHVHLPLLLQGLKECSAVCCWNDLAAYDTMAHAREIGLQVPEDIAVTGFDGLNYAALMLTGLTTISAPWQEAAETAVQLLCASLQGAPLPAETVLPVRFLQGSTS